mmetsp:Transcript_14219/g.13784  ORF Transcript_14219/g.13784 Transcript_14219/m.13784 type:complete len:109 (+) Transcript_14219:239-565(+)
MSHAQEKKCTQSSDTRIPMLQQINGSNKHQNKMSVNNRGLQERNLVFQYDHFIQSPRHIKQANTPLIHKQKFVHDSFPYKQRELINKMSRVTYKRPNIMLNKNLNKQG